MHLTYSMLIHYKLTTHLRLIIITFKHKSKIKKKRYYLESAMMNYGFQTTKKGGTKVTKVL